MSFSSRADAIRQRSSPKSQVMIISSHSYSHESVIFFVFVGLIFDQLRRVCVFSVAMHAATLRLQPLKTSTAGAGQSIILR